MSDKLKRFRYEVVLWDMRHRGFSSAMLALLTAAELMSLSVLRVDLAVSMLPILYLVIWVNISATIVVNKYNVERKKKWGIIDASTVFRYRSDTVYTIELHEKVVAQVSRLIPYSKVIDNWDVGSELEFVRRIFTSKMQHVSGLGLITLENLPSKYAKLGVKSYKAPDSAGWSLGPIISVIEKPGAVTSLHILRHEYAHSVCQDEGFTEYLAVMAGLLSGELNHFLSALLRILHHTQSTIYPSYRDVDDVYTSAILYMDWDKFYTDFIQPLERLSDTELLRYLPLSKERSYKDR